MKNLIIAVLAMQIVTGMSFWEFSGHDRIWVGLGFVALIWITLESLDEWIIDRRRRRRMQKRRADRFKLDVIDLTDDDQEVI
jgi:hypothetical protein